MAIPFRNFIQKHLMFRKAKGKKGRLKVSEHYALKKQNTFLFSLTWFFKLYITMYSF